MSIQAFVLVEAAIVAVVFAIAAKSRAVESQPEVVAIPVKVRDNQ